MIALKDFPPPFLPREIEPARESRRGLDGTVPRTWQANDPDS